ncbi:MAG TPA: collagen-like protein [Acidocella sp.]|nr:collagen-like protein [Acidocella sp.]HQU03654.1 collagen-like protein [Acidocella sp.]
MTTIAQLPTAASVGASDLLLLSQAGSLYAVKVSQLNADLQPLLSVPTGALLGRQSTGIGAPEALSVGTGLALMNGALSATGADHAGYPVQAAMSLSDDVVISNQGSPGLLPVAALRGLFTAGAGLSISATGVIAVTASAIAGPAGPAGATGPAGPVGPQGIAGPAGSGLTAPAAGNSVSSIAGSDYVAIWQNGANAWMPYSQLIGGQTINQLPAAAPASDSDALLVAQGSTSLSVQSFGALWIYMQGKLPSVKAGIVELTANTVLDGTAHNKRILIVSQPVTLTANYSNMGAGFSCTLINLSAGAVTLGTGITSGSGAVSLPPGASASLLGLSYSGGSMVWWNGLISNAPTITVASIAAPAPGASFTVTGGIFSDAPNALDYSTDGGVTWLAAPSPVITHDVYSFIAPGLVAGNYTIRVRDHANIAVMGVSNNFTIMPPSVAINTLPMAAIMNAALTVQGTVLPGNAAVEIGLSSSATVAPTSWVNAAVSNGAWSGAVTPTTMGTLYVWAQQTAATSVQAVSGALSIVTATLTISVPANGAAGTALTVSGTVTPATDAVNLQLSTQNTVAPISGWLVAANNSGSFNISLTPSVAGTYYAWAQDPATGITAVSSAIIVSAATPVSYTINNPGGSYTHGLGVIALNGGISPTQPVPTQVALSTSNTVAPATGWQAASNIYANTLWAVYYTTPAVAGNYYVWVETTAGAAQTVSSFTIAVV